MTKMILLHELCHLKHRSHGSELLGLVEKIMPDYESRKKWLEKNEHLTVMKVGE